METYFWGLLIFITFVSLGFPLMKMFLSLPFPGTKKEAINNLDDFNAEDSPEEKYFKLVMSIKIEISEVIFATRHFSLRKNQMTVLKFIMHKMFRWIKPLFLIQLFVVNIFCFLRLDSLAVDLCMIGQFVFYFLAILGLFTRYQGASKIFFSIPVSFLIFNTATLHALCLALTGEFASPVKQKRIEV